MKASITSFYELKIKEYIDVDREVLLAARKKDDYYSEAISSFKHIKIVCGNKWIHKVLPMKYFSEFEKYVETNLIDSVNCVYTISGTIELVATQDEYIMAFEESLDRKVLSLDIKLPESNKRKADELLSDNDCPKFEASVVRNTGPFSATEEILFAEGVRRFGWSKWHKIAANITTRNHEQVRYFADTSRGSKYEPSSASAQQCAADLALGFKHASELALGSFHTKNDLQDSSSTE